MWFANTLGCASCAQDMMDCDSGVFNEKDITLKVGMGSSRLDVELSKDISTRYIINGNSECIGGGESGKVFKVSNHLGEQFAVKHVTKSNPLLARLPFHEEAHKRLRYIELLKQEIKITQKLDHPNIIKLVETFEDSANIYMIMELCAGGRLKDLIARRMTESDTALVMNQLLGAVSYIHDKEIVHRDIKPDNMMLQNREPLHRNTVKLIDFGCSCPCPDGQRLYERVGTPFFMAPEVVTLRYGLLADVWSCGVCMFNFLSDRLPFAGGSTNETFEAVKRGNFSFNADAWRYISEDAKEFIRGLMTYDPKDRLTAQGALLHRWVRLNAPSRSSGPGSIFRR